MAEKTKAERLSEQLLMKKKHAVHRLDEKEIVNADKFSEEYIRFLNEAKTEREAVLFSVGLAKKNGFKEFDARSKYKAGDKIYYVNRGKAVIFCTIGSEGVKNGVKISAAHIDSPRLDLKPAPLYEDCEQALFKTHYYGGIKKYQWTAFPLALHGVIVKKDSGAVTVTIGEDAGDPVFCVTDLLPHLAGDQMKRTLSEGIKGEDLNLLIGSRPFKDDKASELVKLNIMRILNEKYGIIEEDFLSCELEAVPAVKACDVGFDRSLVGGYGQDDRVCAYTALMAALEVKNLKKTTVTVLADKEETGSSGNTGLGSAYLENFIADLAESEGFSTREVLRKSTCLSADVNAAVDPNYPEVTEKRNSAFINYGVCVTKYTGARGKADTSDASAEFMAYIRKLLDDAGVVWQTGELGKVDAGGGGTVAKYIANMDVDVVDVGVPVLSMHSPFEVVSKIDVYMAYKAFCAYYSE